MAESVDQELILQLQTGSLEALGQLYDRYQRLVYRTALAVTGDTDSAADLLQDVFLRLYRFIDNVDPTRPIEPWLYRMTTNLAYTYVKQRRRWCIPLEDLVDWFSGGGKPNTSDEVEVNEERRRVQSAISKLPLPQRVVIVLYYLNDLSLQEIAEVLEVPEGTVKSRLHYGRLSLRKSLGLNHEPALDLYFEMS
jgi:RNA polymerase sigma-70 factor (ECF subfamily)